MTMKLVVEKDSRIAEIDDMLLQRIQEIEYCRSAGLTDNITSYRDKYFKFLWNDSDNTEKRNH